MNKFTIGRKMLTSGMVFSVAIIFFIKYIAVRYHYPEMLKILGLQDFQSHDVYKNWFFYCAIIWVIIGIFVLCDLQSSPIKMICVILLEMYGISQLLILVVTICCAGYIDEYILFNCLCCLVTAVLSLFPAAIMVNSLW